MREARTGTAADDRVWAERAKTLLKAELKIHGMTYADLVRSLAAIGIAESEPNLRNKISRGNFSAAFFLQCLEAMNSGVLYLRPEVTRGVRLPARALGILQDGMQGEVHRKLPRDE